MEIGAIRGHKVIGSRIVLSMLAGFYPAVFFLSNNWYIFSFPQGTVLVIGASLISLIILLTASFLFECIIKIVFRDKFGRPELSENRSFLFDSILAFLSLLLCIYLTRNTLASLQSLKILFYCLIGLVVIFFTWKTHRNGPSLLMLFLTVLSSLAILGFLSNVYIRSHVPVEEWSALNKPIYDQIKFEKSNNVYLIISEAYSSKRALEAVYDIDNNEFYSELYKLGFRINHNHFSNYNHTLASLPSLFSMEHHYGRINIGNFESVGGRRLLEADVYNPVIDIFRSNHYQIQYLHNVSTLIPNGAKVDYCIPPPSLTYGLEIFFTDQDITEPTVFERDKAENLLAIKKQITFSSHQKESFFSFLYVSFPGHSPSRLKARSKETINKKLEEFRVGYHKKIKEANEKVIDLIAHIIANDPESIIVLIGDHGSWGYRLKEDGKGVEISNGLFILDRFGVLAGIRGPEELNLLVENEIIKSHVNLFRYLFFYLSQDEKILQTTSPDDSYEALYLMAVKNGKILDNFIKIMAPEESGKYNP